MSNADLVSTICPHNHRDQKLSTNAPIPCLMCGADLYPAVSSHTSKPSGPVGQATYPGVRDALHVAAVKLR